jgi:transcriptional regulator with XRE-family HTH domain
VRPQRIAEKPLTANAELDTFIATSLEGRHMTGREPILPGADAQARHPGPRLSLGAELAEARERRRLPLAEAARHVSLEPARLAAIEEGSCLPPAATLHLLATLLGLDARRLEAQRELEAALLRHRLRIDRLEQAIDAAARRLRGTAAPDAATLECLTIELERVLAEPLPPATVAERRARYFSIGHLSDRVLEALQDPIFHRRVEELAREREGAAPSPPASPSPQDHPAPARKDRE